MMKQVRGAVLAGVVAVVPIAMQAQVEGPQRTQVLIRAEAKGNATAPQLQPADVKLEVGGKATPVTSLRPSTGQRGQKVEVALLIDDGLRSNFGTELPDVEKFVKTSVSPNVSIGLGYMRNGHAEFSNGFSNDPETAAKALRLPISSGGISGSPYFVVSDLVKHWPTRTDAAHIILMITNGIDYYNGSVSPLNQNSPYVDAAVTDAQRANVPVYSIYFGRRDVSSNLGSLSGQSYLNQVAEGTGGEAFVQGTINPVSLQPYFNRFNRALAETYAADFDLGGRKMERLKVSTTVPDVKLRAQQQVQASTSATRPEVGDPVLR